ncbi:RNA 3'-terminal phosphate cyclase [Anatilimnocola aggregata]|uniref:RNA 3'-terminal phosphate cyclase n=1 Tax=Anatilimnocola aggregata TaxID=2528021 RepID=A0A517YBD7_9BACT|nr:RNA 3'-terminal phosphate cyclase [Anatilimnocola aggregata]QDU27560.1 RNA 3'-terminal phosphate cyclase [Anatilimnocola aggregata]
MIEIDGSAGEGGGQIVRSSLALSLVTGQPVMLQNIRAKRKNSGLAKQHLVAVQASAAISSARLRGAALGSSQLWFEPGEVQPGEYTFSIGTAGSASLVLQTVLAPLLVASGPSSLVIEGGTHNPLAPPVDFLQRSYAPLVRQLGPGLQLELERHGFYPAGGGRLRVYIEPREPLVGLQLLARGKLLKQRARALVANLPKTIAERECHELRRLSGWAKEWLKAEEVPAHGCGNVVLIELEFEHVTELFVAFGERGVRAEEVARRAWQETEEYLAHAAPVGPHLADQLMLPLAIAAHQGQASEFRTCTLSGHSLTHIDIIQRFLPVQFTQSEPEPGLVDVRVAPQASQPAAAS